MIQSVKIRTVIIPIRKEQIFMHRKKIAVLMASIDREYQQDFASGLASAGSKLGMDVCIFNSQGHMNVAISTSEIGETMIWHPFPSLTVSFPCPRQWAATWP